MGNRLYVYSGPYQGSYTFINNIWHKEIKKYIDCYKNDVVSFIVNLRLMSEGLEHAHVTCEEENDGYLTLLGYRKVTENELVEIDKEVARQQEMQKQETNIEIAEFIKKHPELEVKPKNG